MAAPNVYPVSTLRIWGEFRDTTGTFFDPTVVTVSYEGPGTAVTSKVYGTDAEVIRQDTGQYYLDLDAGISGFWYYRWDGDGAAQESFLQTLPSQFV